MAMNVFIPLLIPLEEDILNTTRLLSKLPPSDVTFEESRYCAVLFEDELPSTLVTTIKAHHNKGFNVNYSIVEGNQDGLFTIDKKTGEIFLSAYLDREMQNAHELVVAADAGSNPAQSLVQITVADINDNAPDILTKKPVFTVVEEDDRNLPLILGKIEAEDKDLVDNQKLLYTISGDGINNYDATDAFFSIDSHTGDIFQLRPLDRDPPNGKPIWRLKVKVQDGQTNWPNLKNLERSLKLQKLKKQVKRSENKPALRTCITENSCITKSGKKVDMTIKNVPHTHDEAFQLVNPINILRRKSDMKLGSAEADNRHSILSYYADDSMSIGEQKLRRKYDQSGNLKWSFNIPTIRSINLFHPRTRNKRSAVTSNYHRLSHRLLRYAIGKRENKIRRRRNNKSASNGLQSLMATVLPVLDGGSCVRLTSFVPNSDSVHEAQLSYMLDQIGSNSPRGENHTSEVNVTIAVKDINDNPPIFLNKTIYGQVQENGPIDLPVVVVEAYDADDVRSGTNAQLTYSIEKNVVDEDTGDPLFTIDPEKGSLRTAVCCLDRETTPEYQLQVVASDGGGLKGTGTVIVRLSDLNDNSPRLSRREWSVTLDESDGNFKQDDSTLFEMTVDDPDSSNYFLFRIVPGSGNGWQNFGLRTKGKVGEVFAISSLDYEDDKQRRGLRFLVEVTDRGPGGWDDRRHVDSAWVSVTLQDINDNSPKFRQKYATVKVSEDVHVGQLLETLKADDPDEGANGHIEYRLLDAWDSLEVNSNGEIRVKRQLDREGQPGVSESIRVIAYDQGDPSRTSTATLSIHLTDVNDTPPRLLPPTLLHVEENLPPKLIGTLLATDDDVWEKGHGPPFSIRLSEFNSNFVKKRIRLSFRPELDNGNGGAEVWTILPLDREEQSQMIVKVTLSDAAGLTATENIVIVVNDVNDNPMKPGAKTVFLWKTLGTSSEAPLGRVFVKDMDDWDVGDKSFAWAQNPHASFTLDQNTGHIFASGQLREGRYDLNFNVSDSLWGQKDIAAKVVVVVRLLTPEALTHAVPLTISPITAMELTREWIPTKGGGILGKVTSALETSLANKVKSIGVVSVYDENPISVSDKKKENYRQTPNKFNIIDVSNFVSDYDSSKWLSKNSEKLITEITEHNYFHSPSSCVWLSARDQNNDYMDIVKLTGLLELSLSEIEKQTNFSLNIGSCGEDSFHVSSSLGNSSFATPDPSAAASLASTKLPLQVVDSNKTSLVTPRLKSSKMCSYPLPVASSTMECSHFQCLNGGRCIPTQTSSRCVCPGHTTGPFCAVTSRSFSSNSWVWLDPLSPCLPIELSFEFLTRYSEGMLMYAGPLSSTNASHFQLNQPILVIQVLNGRPQLLLHGFSEPKQLEIKSLNSMNDGEWHSLYLKIDSQGIIFMLDNCSARNKDENIKFSTCFVYSEWTHQLQEEIFHNSQSPLQIGGIANEPPELENISSDQITSQSLRGCIANLRIRKQLVDLGEPKFFHNSHEGCLLQDQSCQSLLNGCGGKGTCMGGLNSGTYCSCALGWTGKYCKEPTKSISLASNGFIKIAFSFIPNPLQLTFGLRMKTKLKSGIIFKLKSQNNFASLAFIIQKGTPCLIYSSRSESVQNSSPVSIVGITSSSSFKVLNTTNTFFIKDWNQFDDSKESKTKTSSSSNSDKLLSSSFSVCASGRNISNGKWYHVRGGKLGYNLHLDIINENMMHSNETLVVTNIYHDFVKNNMRKKLKDPPDQFIVDSREGLMVGNLKEIPENSEENDQNFTDPETCLEDLRIMGRPLPLPPVVNGTRWGQVSASGFVRVGCVATSKCTSALCSPDKVCVDDWHQPSCSCKPHHRLFPHGCHTFDVCLFNPCLNGGTCLKNTENFDCLCQSQYTGNHCQWQMTPVKSNWYMTPLVVGVITTLLLLVVFLMALIVHYLKKKSLRHRANSKDNDDKSIRTDELSSAFISIEMKSDLDCKDSSSRMEDLRLETKMRGEIQQMKQSFGSEKNKRKAPDGISHNPNLRIENIAGERLAVLLPRDDLRAYAYEGEGGASSEGSLGSAISDMRKELNRETDDSISLPPNLSEVVDLLRNLPDASLHFPRSPKLKSKLSNAKQSNLTAAEGATQRADTGVIYKRFTMNSSTEELSGAEGETLNRRKKSTTSSSFWSENPAKSASSSISVISISPTNKSSPKKKSSSKSSSGKSSKLGSSKKKTNHSKSKDKVDRIDQSTHISLHV